MLDFKVVCPFSFSFKNFSALKSVSNYEIKISNDFVKYTNFSSKVVINLFNGRFWRVNGNCGLLKVKLYLKSSPGSALRTISTICVAILEVTKSR